MAAGQRAAAITSLIQSAKFNGHDPYAYMRDVLALIKRLDKAIGPAWSDDLFIDEVADGRGQRL